MLKFTPCPQMGQTGVIKSQIVCIRPLSPLLLLLEVLNVLGGNEKPFAGCPETR